MLAGFSDAIAKLKEVEENNPDDALSSLYLARHYLKIRSFDEFNTQTKIARNRAKTDEARADLELLESEALEITADKTKAAEYLEDKVESIDDKNKNFECSTELANYIRTRKTRIEQ